MTGRRFAYLTSVTLSKQQIMKMILKKVEEYLDGIDNGKRSVWVFCFRKGTDSPFYKGIHGKGGITERWLKYCCRITSSPTKPDIHTHTTDTHIIGYISYIIPRSKAKASYDLKIAKWAIKPVKPRLQKKLRIYLDGLTKLISKEEHNEASRIHLNNIHSAVNACIKTRGSVDPLILIPEILPLIEIVETIGYKSCSIIS